MDDNTPKRQFSGRSQAITRVEICELQHTWLIANFENHKNSGNFITGPTFADEQSGTKWRLALNIDTEGDIVLTLQLVHSKSGVVRLRYRRLGLSDFSCKANFLGKIVDVHSEPDSSARLREIGLLKSDHLTITCEISIDNTITDFSGEINFPCDHEDLLNQLGEEKFSDVTLCANGKEFKAHKVILSARSPVFRAMFSHDMKENQNNRVDLEDIEPDILKQMLMFIYSGKTNLKFGDGPDKADKQYLATELLKASDRYHLDRLKFICEKVLSEMLNVESAAEILALSEMFNANLLRDHASKLINSCAMDVVKTDGWRKISTENPSVLVIALSALKK